VSDLPKGYLRCTRCTATFPGKRDDGSNVGTCPGCGMSTESLRLRTARMFLRAVDPSGKGPAAPGGRFGGFEVGVIVVIVISLLGAAGAVAFLLMRR
jgi:hypothetical protein